MKILYESTVLLQGQIYNTLVNYYIFHICKKLGTKNLTTLILISVMLLSSKLSCIGRNSKMEASHLMDG